MALMRRAVRASLPQRIFGPRLLAVIDAVADAMQRAYDAVAALVRESLPGNAVTTLEMWFEQLGIPYDPTLSVDLLQRLARQKWATAGGHAVDALNEAVQIAFPTVSVARWVTSTAGMVGLAECGVTECEDYPSWYTGAETGEEPTGYYFVFGTVDQFEEFERLVGLLSRIGPAELAPIFSVDILSDTITSEAGIASCNLAECNAE